jgi:DNA-directed RNA polymerase specialized sigma24 family protein
MAPEATLARLTLTGIAHRCAQETELFFQRLRSDSQYCYELFRRAIVERDQRAWAFLYEHYRTLVIGWIRRHPSFPSSGEETQFFVNRTFERMWSALTPQKFERFPTLSALLRYLQLCVHSTILDHAQAAERHALLAATDTEQEIPVTSDAVVEEEVLSQMGQQAFWQEVQSRLHGEHEVRVVYDSFVLGLKPRQILERAPNLFSDVKEVYQVKENVLSRFKRDADLRERLRQHG